MTTLLGASLILLVAQAGMRVQSGDARRTCLQLDRRTWAEDSRSRVSLRAAWRVPMLLAAAGGSVYNATAFVYCLREWLLTYFASRQFSPTPTSAISGTSSL